MAVSGMPSILCVVESLMTETPLIRAADIMLHLDTFYSIPLLAKYCWLRRSMDATASSRSSISNVEEEGVSRVLARCLVN